MASNRAVYFSTLVAALGGLLFGFDTAVISGTTESLQRVFGLDEFWLGFTVASALIGTIIGAFAVGKPGDTYGRRRLLMVLAALYFISALGSALAQTWTGFLVYRFIGGLGVGGASVMAPMYIAEIAPKEQRGRLVALNQLNIVAGILVAYLSNYAVASAIDAPWEWRMMFAVEAVPALIFFILLFFIPSSPRWLVKQNREEEARSVLETIGIPNVAQELGYIVESLREQRHKPDAPLFKRELAFPIFCAWAIAMFNQLSGINALMYYAPSIFQMAGAASDQALLQSVAIGGTNFAFTVLALFIIDRFGRRPLLLIGSVGTALCLAVVAAEFYAAQATGWLVLAGLLGFIAFFAMSQGAVIWVFISEIFPNRVRSKGQSLGSLTHWVMAAVVSWTFPVIADASGGHAFAFFSAMMILQFVFAWFVMPETKGKSLEELEAELGLTDLSLADEAPADAPEAEPSPSGASSVTE